MNALEFLRFDHQRISDLFEQFHQASSLDAQWDSFDLIHDELTAHYGIEERLFYPVFKEHEEYRELIEDSLDMHGEISDVLEQIDEMDDESDLEDRVDELQQMVDEHFADEERDLFPGARKVLGEKQLEELGERMAEARKTPSAA